MNEITYLKKIAFTFHFVVNLTEKKEN